MKTYIVVVFVYLHCNTMKADFNFKENTYSLMSKSDGHFIAYPTNTLECSKVLDAFSDFASNFTKCSIQHARPIRLCAECIEQYMNFKKQYDLLLNTVDTNGISCKSLFISHDRLDAVLDYHDSILAVWEKGHCNACYNWTQGKPELSNDTNNFKKKFNETMDCIIQYFNPDANNTDEVCQNCMLTYIQLDEFYKSLSSDSIGLDSVCMDIVDSMNATRYIWSKVLNCCKLRRSPEIIFLCCTAIIAMLPLLFYVAVRFCGPIRDLPNVLKQSRFKQIILRSSGGRIN